MKQNSGDKNLENFQQIFLTLFLVLELWHNIHYIIHNGSDSHKKSKKITKTTTTISYQRGKINTHRVIIMRQISTEILIFLLTLVHNMHLVLTVLFAITRSPEIIWICLCHVTTFVDSCAKIKWKFRCLSDTRWALNLNPLSRF